VAVGVMLGALAVLLVDDKRDKRPRGLDPVLVDPRGFLVGNLGVFAPLLPPFFALPLQVAPRRGAKVSSVPR